MCMLACLYVIQLYGPGLPVESTARVPYRGICKGSVTVKSLHQ